MALHLLLREYLLLLSSGVVYILHSPVRDTLGDKKVVTSSGCKSLVLLFVIFFLSNLRCSVVLEALDKPVPTLTRDLSYVCVLAF